MEESNLHPIHREAFIELRGMGVPKQILQNYYAKMLILANIPQKDWQKQSTTKLLKPELGN